ncbi:MAG: hypothetical protein KA974_01285 [Saprospiraceae bacterium]|nr:hypothetical protein [Saprospiraceae bacterium]MBP7679611.1 hypothetical protein [Saprospiraceae bacterium]
MSFFTQLFSALNTQDSFLVLFFLFVSWLIGLLTGWWIWGRKIQRLEATISTQADEIADLRAKLTTLTSDYQKKTDRLEKVLFELDDNAATIRKHEAEKGQIYANYLASSKEVDTLTVELAKCRGSKSTATTETTQSGVASGDGSVATSLQAMASAAAAIVNPDDLKKIEGIGPKIEQLLNDGGIHTFRQLADSSYERLKEILDAAGERYRIHDPTTWPNQAHMAAAGLWEELRVYQEQLDGGKE